MGLNATIRAKAENPPLRPGKYGWETRRELGAVYDLASYLPLSLLLPVKYTVLSRERCSWVSEKPPSRQSGGQALRVIYRRGGLPVLGVLSSGSAPSSWPSSCDVSPREKDVPHPGHRRV